MPFYAFKDPDGEILPFTLKERRADCLFELFPNMPAQFQTRCWKDIPKTMRALRALGYRLVKVRVVEDKG